MSAKTKRPENSHGGMFGLSMEDLKGKQSVRATFRLPKRVIDLLSVLSGQLGIKQKSLFDQLIEDATILGQIAEGARDFSPAQKDRCQKTFVISRSSLVSLDFIAERERIPRDLLVEISIKRLLPLIESELEKHQKRKILLKEMNDYAKQGRRLLEKAEDLLGVDDKLYELISQQVNLAERNLLTLKRMVEKGSPMENW